MNLDTDILKSIVMYDSLTSVAKYIDPCHGHDDFSQLLFLMGEVDKYHELQMDPLV